MQRTQDGGLLSASITRNSFLKMSTATAAAAALDPLGIRQAVAAATGVKKPNIVFVFSDEHRWSSLPFTEMPQVKVPQMERLAHEGMRFDNCVSNSPICIPYRGMLITGQWPHQSSCISNNYFGNHDVIGVECPTIAHTFKQGGYVTGYVGKWHLANETVFNAGFDYFKHWLFGDEHWETQVRDVPSREEFQVHKGYNAVGMTDQALEFIGQNADGEKPFMLMLSINPPHWRWDDAPEEFVKLYPEKQMDFRPNVAERYKSGKELLFYRHYHAHISAIDVQIGRLLDALKQHGIEDNTVFIYTSDHGSSFGSNGVGSKANPYEEAVRVPFIVKWPGRVKPDTIVDNNLGTIDLYPTLCGLAGLAWPEHCGGQDFSPVMLGRPGPDPEAQLLLVNNFQRNYYRRRLGSDDNSFCPFRGVRSKRYTYVVGADGEWLLYDNKTDPYQMNNLVHDPDFAEIKAGLAGDVSAEQTAKLCEAADGIFDAGFFGMFVTLDNEVNGKKKYGKLTPEEATAALAAHNVKYAGLFKEAAERILR